MPTGLLTLIRRRWTLPMLASLTLAVLGGVAAEGVAKTCGNLTVGKKSSGQTVTLHRCERLTIRLNEAFDGGYQWKATRRPAPSILKLLSDRAISNAPKGAVGGTDTRVFVYRAVGKGRTSLKLTESRPFVPHSQIAKFTLIVRVR